MTFTKALISLALGSLLCMQANAQTALVMTTLSSAATADTKTLNVTSATGISTTTVMYIYDYGAAAGEFINQVSAISSTRITVRRDYRPKAHASGAVVIIAPSAAAFVKVNPMGACTAAATLYTPVINIDTGQQSLCSTLTGTWVPGWGGNGGPVAGTANVASVAGATLPSGPLFHVTGTNAITGWTLPVGFHGGTFQAIFDGAATWTAAGNIMSASLEATVAGCLVSFTYENVAAKWYPSTIDCNPTP